MKLRQGVGIIGFLVAAVLCVPGCCDSKNQAEAVSTNSLLEVKGKIMLGDEPLTYGWVNFVPDRRKGNKLSVSPSAKVNPDGTYQLMTEDREGVPDGWYKVTVVTNDPGAPENAPVIPQRYTRADLTDLSMEVTNEDGPKSYDIKLSKK